MFIYVNFIAIENTQVAERRPFGAYQRIADDFEMYLASHTREEILADISRLEKLPEGTLDLTDLFK
ncbi:Uncharacterised protein [uncultured archaeon]|nr:Uncharacterised protein [uncultured archaeon]